MNQPTQIMLALPAIFPAGQLVITANADTKLTQQDSLKALARHVSGDWGEVRGHDRLVNEEALKKGERRHSVYRSEAGQEFWIMTEWDQSVTTTLMPSDD